MISVAVELIPAAAELPCDRPARMAPHPDPQDLAKVAQPVSFISGPKAVSLGLYSTYFCSYDVLWSPASTEWPKIEGRTHNCPLLVSADIVVCVHLS